jgi:endo-1,3(4)-beta-glucanase
MKRAGRQGASNCQVGAAATYRPPLPLFCAPQLRTTLKAALDLWLAPGATRLLYDTTWGGIVSAAGLQQSGADFGSGIYNDHHFHYGYLMYAAAALGAKDPEWLKARTPALLDIIRDFANPGVADPYFPFAREMDFYAGARGGWRG